MIDWTKPLKPNKRLLGANKAELLKNLNGIGNYNYIVLFTSESGLEDVLFLDKKGRDSFGDQFLESNVEPVKPRKHADVIKAWADGYKIAVFSPALGEWYEEPLPIFDSKCQYTVAVIDGQGYEGPAEVVKV